MLSAEKTSQGELLGSGNTTVDKGIVDATMLSQEFTSVVEDMGFPNTAVSELLDEFEHLSVQEKTDLINTLQGDDPAAAFEFVESEATTSVQPSASSASTLVKGAVDAAKAQTYEVTAHYKKDLLLLGVKIGTWNLRYKYQTGSNKVLKDYSCTNWYSGLSGFWNFSTSSTHRVAAGRGYCTGIFRGSLVYKGSGVTMNKEMGMIVNGPGYVSRWLKNI